MTDHEDEYQWHTGKKRSSGVEDAVELAGIELRRRNVAIHTYVAQRLPVLMVDPILIEQVVLNLLKNAAEAITSDPALTERGTGEIVLTTAYQHGMRLAVAGSDHRLHLPLVVTVRDNGPGIPEDIRSHLFEAFVTSKPSGSGLGLALVAKIVGDHGGLIEVDSRPGRTDFRLCLPVLNEHDSDVP